MAFNLSIHFISRTFHIFIIISLRIVLLIITNNLKKEYMLKYIIPSVNTGEAAFSPPTADNTEIRNLQYLLLIYQYDNITER